jgi:hypothetical protein
MLDAGIIILPAFREYRRSPVASETTSTAHTPRSMIGAPKTRPRSDWISRTAAGRAAGDVLGDCLPAHAGRAMTVARTQMTRRVRQPETRQVI